LAKNPASRHFFQPGGVHPSQKALSKVAESGGLAWKWIGVFNYPSQLQACYF
jgi:hypothetical protein